MPTAIRRFDFVQVDVFTSRPLEGNPLAVFTDARGLSDSEMRAVAREMNLSETTFVLPGENAVESATRVRIFTVEEELPFAGHPTLGTAFVLRKETGRQEITLDLAAGKIPVTFREGNDGQIFGEMRQRDPEFGTVHSAEAVALAAGLSLTDIDSSLPIQTVSTGVAFAVVPLRSLAAIRKMRLNWPRVAEYLDRSDSKFLYFVTRETVDPSARLHARMIFYNAEDPATGSAAGCTAAWMVRYKVVSPEEGAMIEQGLEIKRPSQIFVRAALSGNRVVNVRVGGNTIEILGGQVFL